MQLIPAIDLRAGRCVRLYQGNFAAETCYAPAPEQLLCHYQGLGARWLHVVDLDGARAGARAHAAVIAALASLGTLQLQAGGGVRSSQAIRELLEAGVARVVIGSAALERPEEVARWLGRFGAQRLCLAFDVRVETGGEPRVHTHGWTQDSGVSLWEAIGRYGTGSQPRSLSHRRRALPRSGLAGVRWCSRRRRSRRPGTDRGRGRRERQGAVGGTDQL